MKSKLKKILYCSCLLSFLLVGATAQDKLENYIPYPEDTLGYHPEITIRVHVHILKRSENDPQNITEDSVEYLRMQMVWINEMYQYMHQPRLRAKDGNKYYVPDSKIRFRLDSVLTHTDSSHWDRIRTEIYMSGGAPWKIDTVNLATNEVGFRGAKTYLIQKHADSLKIVGSTGNNGIYHKLKVRENDGITYVKLKQPLKLSIADGKISYFTEKNRNCSSDIWKKYTNSDKNALHIFYTGSSRVGNSFGCGPSPYFLNVSNLIKGGGYANAQLSGHELGHCIGLHHTNHPQFKDLPATDKFGWIQCDDKQVSNNIMGYNMCRNYLSPMQIGFVHKRYTTDPKLIRLTTANEYDQVNNIEVWDNTIWNKAMVITGDVIVRKRQTLEINYPVHMAEGTGIYLEKKAKLIVNGVTITNHFEGAQWNGAVICKSYQRKHKEPKKAKNKGVVILKGEALLEKVNQVQPKRIPHWED